MRREDDASNTQNQGLCLKRRRDGGRVSMQQEENGTPCSRDDCERAADIAEESMLPLQKRSRPSFSPSFHKENRTMETIHRLQSLLKFWLSPHNLSKDVHLIRALTDHPEGWTPVSVFMTFNKVRALPADESLVFRALQELRTPRIEFESIRPVENDGRGQCHSKTEHPRFRILGGNDRLRKYITSAMTNVNERTVFATHVPSDADREKIIAAFQKFGKVVYATLPRNSDSSPKGFAFVEFVSVDHARRCVAAVSRAHGASSHVRQPPFPSLPGIHVFPYAEWRRRHEIRRRRNRGVDINFRKENGLGDSVVLDEQASPKQGEIAKPSGNEENGKHKGDDCYLRGLVLHVEGLNNATSSTAIPSKTQGGGVVSRRRLYGAFEEYGPVSFIEYCPSRGDECYVRFLHGSAASRALTALSGMDPSAPNTPRARILGGLVHAEILTGQAERNYWDRVSAGRALKANRKAQRGNKERT